VGFDLVPGPCTTVLGDVAEAPAVDSVVREVDAIVHTASLHAPHVVSHSKSEFVRTNVRGTCRLLEAAIRHGVSRFVYTSTTSLYGYALVPQEEAVWVTEELTPRPRDIYDETKIAAERRCQDASAKHGLPCVSLRIGRCFRESDALVALYRLYRGVDVRDVADAHRLALMAETARYSCYNIAAQTPFLREDVRELMRDATVVIRRRCPGLDQEFHRRGWRLPVRIDRVYVIDNVRDELGYVPAHNYEELVARIKA
jgi:nucleoside-diphosphate-sugar epimerase